MFSADDRSSPIYSFCMCGPKYNCALGYLYSLYIIQWLQNHIIVFINLLFFKGCEHVLCVKSSHVKQCANYECLDTCMKVSLINISAFFQIELFHKDSTSLIRIKSM